MDEHHNKGSDFFLGLVGVGAIGLLTAMMLLTVLTFSGPSQLTYVDARPPAGMDNIGQN